MPARKRGRFSRLANSLRDAKGVTSPGNAIDDYLNFLKGVNKIKVARKPSSAALGRFRVGVYPFGVTPAATTPRRYVASMTNQAELIRVETALSENNFGIDSTVTIPPKEDPLYCPAYCKVFMVLNTVVASTPSQSNILKSQPAYKSYKGRSGSIPFGRTLTDVTDSVTNAQETVLSEVDEEDVRAVLAFALKGKVGATYRVKGVSFVSELWLSPKARLGTKGTLPTALDA